MTTYQNPGFPVFPADSVDMLLVRHGESAPLSDGESFPLHAGHGDPPLSPKGREQVAGLTERLADTGIDAIYTSDLARARETGAPLAARTGIGATELAELREVFLGEWEGGVYRRMAAELGPRFVEHVSLGTWAPVPGAETDEAVRQRAAGVLADVSKRHSAARVMIVAHAGLIGAMIAEVTGSDRALPTVVDQTSITQVVALADGPMVLRRLNDTGHLGDPLLQSVLATG